VGEGDVDWEQVFRLCESVGGTEWYIVEQKGYNTEPLESVRKCLKNLRRMGK
jgi:sugar phosphate isomerase/epimerase